MQDLENLIDDRFQRFKVFQPIFLSQNCFKAEIESQKTSDYNKSSLYLSHSINKSILEWNQQVKNYKYLLYADNLLALLSLKYTINENWSIKGSIKGDKEGVQLNMQGQFINEQNYLASIISLSNDKTYKLGLKYKYIDDKNQMLLKSHLEFIVGSLFNLSKLDFSANKSYDQYTFYSGGNIEDQLNLWSGVKRQIKNATIYLNFLQFDYRSAILMLHWKITWVQHMQYPQGQNSIIRQCLWRIIQNLAQVQSCRNLSQIRSDIIYIFIDIFQKQINNQIKYGLENWLTYVTRSNSCIRLWDIHNLPITPITVASIFVFPKIFFQCCSWIDFYYFISGNFSIFVQENLKEENTLIFYNKYHGVISGSFYSSD